VTGSAVVEDLDGSLRGWFVRQQGTVAVVRPDRYLAALAAPSDLASVSGAFERLADTLTTAGSRRGRSGVVIVEYASTEAALIMWLVPCRGHHVTVSIFSDQRTDLANISTSIQNRPQKHGIYHGDRER
jgi:hypothetical protein